MKPMLVYLILINAASLLLMLADKRRAKKNAWRIPEAVLMTCAIAGGSPGILVGMYAVRHKTRHPKFSIGVPVILAVQLFLWVIIMSKYM
jgi:uncharacterized membrane protein YsdA (DUF1294 family)